MIFGRTDLRKGVSEAKFDVEAAGDVKNSKINRKSAENHEKPEIFSKKIFRRRKIESCKSSETRFPEVSCRSEPSSRGERTFEVRIFMVEYVRIRLISGRIVLSQTTTTTILSPSLPSLPFFAFFAYNTTTN